MCEPFTSHCPGSHARGPVCTLQDVGCAELASVRAALPGSVARVPGGSSRPAGVAMDTTRLELRKAGADEALLQVSAEMRRLQRASRLEQGRVRRVLDRVSEVAFIVFVWSCPDATMALAYVADQEGRRQLPFPTLTREELEGRYLKTPVEVLGDIWRGVEGCRPGCFAEAKRYHRDFGLSTWVQDQNEKKAVAPTPQIIIRRLRAMAAAEEPFSQSSSLRLDAMWASTKWVWRWRHRWGLRFGSYGAREHMSGAEKQEKARGSVPERGVRELARTRARGAAKGGPPGGPHFGDRLRVVLVFA